MLSDTKKNQQDFKKRYKFWSIYHAASRQLPYITALVLFSDLGAAEKI
jgi:hypothetical protein